MMTSAPALMNGLRGMPCSYSSWTRELNGLPEGSLPTRRQTASPSRASVRARVKTLEMLWMEKGIQLSPNSAVSPSQVITARPKRAPSTRARAGM